jgi:DNA-binding transcriptional ArsR family regulator
VSKRRDAFAAIADPTRRAILDLLRDRERMTAGHIAAQFPGVTRPAISKHLRVLSGARLVRAQVRGRERLYELDTRPLREVYEKWLIAFAPHWDGRLRRLKTQAEK